MASVPIFVVVTQARDTVLGSLLPPRAGAVPIADGAGGAAWADSALGSVRWFDATVFDDGEAKFVWDSVNRQPAFASAGTTWFGEFGYFSEIYHVFDNDGPGMLARTLNAQELAAADFYIARPRVRPCTSRAPC